MSRRKRSKKRSIRLPASTRIADVRKKNELKRISIISMIMGSISGIIILIGAFALIIASGLYAPTIPWRM